MFSDDHESGQDNEKSDGAIETLEQNEVGKRKQPQKGVQAEGQNPHRRLARKMRARKRQLFPGTENRFVRDERYCGEERDLCDSARSEKLVFEWERNQQHANRPNDQHNTIDRVEPCLATSGFRELKDPIRSQLGWERKQMPQSNKKKREHHNVGVNENRNV